MNSIVKWLDKLPFSFLLTAGMTGILFLVPLFTIGTFDDGIFYACISRNLATEPGENIWILKVSNALDPHFHGHPPLAFWLQALFFKVLGDHFWIEKLYGLIMAVFSFYLMGKLYKILTHSTKTEKPVFFVLCIPLIGWSFGNNMLENSLTPIILMAVLLYLQFQKKEKKQILYLLLFTFFIFLGFLTKGPVALFLWIVPMAYHFKDFQKQFKLILFETIFTIFFSFVFFFILILLLPDSKSFFQSYFDLQIKGSLATQGDIISRFYLLKIFLEESIILHILSIFLYFFARFKRIPLDFFNQHSFFILQLFLSSSLPFLVSTKQLGHYLIPAFFLYALYWMLVFKNVTEYLFVEFKKSKVEILLKGILLFTFIISLVLSNSFYGRYSRHEKLFSDLDQIAKKTGAHKELWIDNQLYTDWKIHGYLYRYYHIDLSTVYKSQNYAIGYQKSNQIDTSKYKQVEFSLKELYLYKHKTK